MSWKSIEMQVALPRTQDAGKLQEQIMKQNQHFQESLAQSQLKEANEKRKRVQEFERINDVEIKDQHQDNPDSESQQEDSKDDRNDKSVKHPYLGQKIDFSG